MRGLLASPLGFLIGVTLGALGGGGSILAVPALVYAAGQDPKAATTTSLLVVGALAIGGLGAHWRAGRVRFRAGLIFGLVGVGGSLVGSALNRRVDPNVLLVAFSGVMLLAAWRMVVSRTPPAPAGAPVPATGEDTRGAADAGPEQAARDGRAAVATGTRAEVSVGTSAPARTEVAFDAATVLKVAIAGTLVGLMTGFFGVGGGFVIVPALVLVLRFPMPEAVGTSLLVIAINSAVALSSRLAGSGIEWKVAAPFLVAGLGGVSVGSRLAERIPAHRLVGWFAALLVGVALYTAGRSIAALGA